MALTVYSDPAGTAPAPQRIAVVGLGYIGLPTAAALAQAGHQVVGVDVNPSVVASVNAGECHIVEPGLHELLKVVVAGGKLFASQEMPAAQAYLIAVPTPVSHDGRFAPDLSYVFAATDMIAPRLERGALIVLESTCPVGATRQMISRLAQARSDLSFPDPASPDGEADVDIVYSPERVIPGRTLQELSTNARVLGGATQSAAQRAARLYRSLTSGELLLTDDRSAEMVKLVENAFRDVNIAFANELSLICDRIGLNVWDLISLANHHPRVNILRPGPGVGGHCIAIDPWFIVAEAPEEARLIRAAREINDGKPDFVVDKVRAHLLANPESTAACLGLAFKPDVDDFRESPALLIAERLTREFPKRIVCCDPHAALIGDHALTVVELDQALDCGIIVGLVAHDEYRRLPPPRGIVVDTGGLWT